MFDFILSFKRNKSIIRSTSGPCYPYPRSHTPMMIIPTNRPVGVEEKPKKYRMPRRRPPLNTAIPTIPESKSNESIMSHISRVSTTATDKVESSTDGDCVIIENRTAVDGLRTIPRLTGSTISESSSSKTMPHRTTEPRSPLMTVAHTVRSKLSKLTRRKPPTERSNSIKTSQSFSGMRVTRAPPVKRVDENANRVIKSSSMDVPISSNIPSTSKVVIPQNPEPLASEDNSLRDDGQTATATTEQPIQKTVVIVDQTTKCEMAELKEEQESPPEVIYDEPEIVERVVKFVGEKLEVDDIMEEDYIKENKEFEEVRRIEETVTETTTQSCQLPVEEQVVQTIIMTERSHIPLSVSFSTMEPEYAQLPPSILESPGDKENASSTSVQTPRTARKVLEDSTAAQRNTQSPERYILLCKTPEAVRRHKVVTIEESPPKKEEVDQSSEVVNQKKKKTKPMKRSKSEEKPTTCRYVMTVKTPEPLRRHHTFVIGESDNKTEVEKTILESRRSVKKKEKEEKTVKDEPREESRERYVMMVKTPLTMRRVKSFVIENKKFEDEVEVDKKVEEPVMVEKVEVKVEEKMEKKEIQKSKTMEDELIQREKFILITTARQTANLRRHNTFVIGERPRSPDVPWIEEGELTEPIATVGPLAYKKRTRSEEPRKTRSVEDKPQERFILTTRTPIALRKYNTFVVGDKKETTDTKMSQSHSADTQLLRGREVNNKLIKTSATFTEGDKKRKPSDSKSPERFIMTATTPLTMRKFTSFQVEEKVKSHIDNIIDSDLDEPRSPVKPSEMYCLTATTPLVSRKQWDMDPSENTSVARDSTPSPERRTLFVMGKRSSPGSSERKELLEKKTSLHLEGIKENSQSDRAERKMSFLSGEMTSPEEDIPMDTQQTPDDEPEVVLPLKSVKITTSPISEEPVRDSPPVFCPPSPPLEKFVLMTSSKSTSPIKSCNTDSKPEISTTSSEQKDKRLEKETKREKKKLEKEKQKKEKRDDKEKISSRSLRNAGRMFAPAFFRKERRVQKVVPPKSMSFPTRPNMQLNVRAPLAEFESTVVENSPLVENHPLTFEKWDNSPWNRRRLSQEKGFENGVINEESDGNGNPHSNSFDKGLVSSPLLGRHHDQDKGLIDDEILDQPMLVGDTFSHSESIECLSAVRRMEFEADKATLISIDRSVVEDVEAPRRHDNGNAHRTPSSVVAPFYTVNSQPRTMDVSLDDSLGQVQDIKLQLQQLQMFVQQESDRTADESKEALIRENDALRRQLIEQDHIITSLKQQLAALKT